MSARARDVVAALFERLGAGGTPDELSLYYGDDVVGDGERCIVLGNLETEVVATGRTIVSDFAFDVVVRDGLIRRYHMFEDTWSVANACAPGAPDS